MLSVYYLTLAFLVVVTNAVVLQKEGLENVLDVGPEYATMKKGSIMQTEKGLEKEELGHNSNSEALHHQETINRLGMDQNFPAKSCKEIYDTNPNSRSNSGYYWVKSLEGTAKVYCEMSLPIDGLSGWTLIVNMTNIGTCPGNWRFDRIPGSSVTGCRAANDESGCYSAIFSTNASSSGYSQVTGYLVAYQKGKTNGFIASASDVGKWINGPYLDGVSITYGDPRKHLFSYAVGYSDNYNYPAFNCPCAEYPGQDPPSFVRDDYYCDSGTAGKPSQHFTYKTPLFEDMECTDGNNCCAQVESPWFYRLIPGYPITDAIEVRICGNQDWSDEGTIISELVLYVQ